MYLLHHQVYDPVDVIWDAEDWADLTDDTPSFLSSPPKEPNMPEPDMDPDYDSTEPDYGNEPDPDDMDEPDTGDYRQDAYADWCS